MLVVNKNKRRQFFKTFGSFILKSFQASGTQILLSTLKHDTNKILKFGFFEKLVMKGKTVDFLGSQLFHLIFQYNNLQLLNFAIFTLKC